MLSVVDAYGTVVVVVVFLDENVVKMGKTMIMMETSRC